MKYFKKSVLLVLLALNTILYSQNQSSYELSKLEISWGVKANNYNAEAKVLSEFNFTNTDSKDFPASGWILYFNYNKKVYPSSNPTEFTLTHLNGDLYQMAPSSLFKGLKPNQSIAFGFVSEGKILNLSAAPDGPYLVWNSNPAKGYSLKSYTIKPIIDTTINYVSPKSTYEKNQSIEDIALADLPRIFPKPNYYKENTGTFILDKKVSIEAHSEFLKEANYLSEELNPIMLRKIEVNPMKKTPRKIVFKKIALEKEAYILDIQSDKIEISAGTAAGIFYGIQSLKSMIPLLYWKTKSEAIPFLNSRVEDKPRFEYRGFMFDVARNFHSKETIFRILDLMAMYKLNRFHFHFTDDEGWRIEIPSLQELTQVGAKRAHTLDSKNSIQPAYGSGPDGDSTIGSGFYTKADFIEILKYANARHIEVIPEIESPGHSRAAIKAMDARYNRFMEAGNREEAERYLLRDINDQSVYSSAQLWNDNVMCVALPSTYTFMEKVIDEILAMYQEADAPIETIHLGGDEVPNGSWKGSPVSTKLIAENDKVNSVEDLWYYYYDKMEAIMAQRKLTVSGWEEIAMRKTLLDGKNKDIANPDFANKGFRAYVWNNAIGWGSEDLPYKLANSGYKVVISGVSNLYFDLAYEKSTEEIGYYWGGFNDTEKPFYFIPFDHFKNTREDTAGEPINLEMFKGKERLTDYGKSNILGIQAQLFSENIRDTVKLEYLLLPKLLALAERNWVANPSWATEKDTNKSKELYDRDWSVFTNVLGKKELPRLDYYGGGFGYRIPTVGISTESGYVKANIQMPGFTIRYTTDGSEPNIKSAIYIKPIKTKGKISFAAFSDKGRKGRSTTIENK